MHTHAYTHACLHMYAHMHKCIHRQIRTLFSFFFWPWHEQTLACFGGATPKDSGIFIHGVDLSQLLGCFSRAAKAEEQWSEWIHYLRAAVQP